MTISEFLKTLAPNFMWCSRHDLFLMYEQINEDIDYFSFRVSLSKQVKRKNFITKPDPSHNRSGDLRRLLYLRIT